MRVAFSSRLPWLSVTLLWLTYSLLGWHLSAYSPVWLVASLGLAVGFAFILVWGSYVLSWITIGLRGVLLALALSALICIAFVFSKLFFQLVLLLVAELFAALEMHTTDFSRNRMLWILILTAEIGIVLGWLTGVVLLPSSGYWFPALNYLDKLYSLA